jgi:hypothetical protein
LKNAINEIYRPNATVGDGGTADIIRAELSRGETTHILKGFERITNLERIIKKQNLSSKDLKIAIDLLSDLKDALKGVNKP